VFGKKEIAEVSLANPSHPKIFSSLPPEQLGEVNDLAYAGGNLLLLGERGLQVANFSGAHVKDSIQVDATRRVEVKDRFALIVGQRKLQVFDLSPYRQVAVPAATLPASAAPTE
jgi:hypothetical protein